VAMAAAMMKRKKFVKVNMANKIESAGGVPGRLCSMYIHGAGSAHDGTYVREIEEIEMMCLLH
jgi:hypothetical protein